MVMNRELRHLCQLLWGAIGAVEPIRTAAPDWSKWLALADEHKLSAFLYNRYRANPPWPDAVHTELAARYVPSGFLNALRRREQLRVLAALSLRCDFVVLKGAALSLLLYEEAAERDMVDLDLYLPAERDVEAALEVLRERQFSPTRRMPDHHHLPPMLHRSGRLSVELHTNLTSPPLPAAFLRRFFADRVIVSAPGGLSIPVADRPHLLFHHCLHTLKDPIESPLLRNLFEIAWIAKVCTAEDWAHFWEISASSLRDQIARRALAMAQDFFPVETPPFKRPGYSSIEFWARRRLGWMDSSLGPVGRRIRHIGVKHFDTMPTGRWSWDAPDMLRVVAKSVWNGIRSHLRPFYAPRSNTLLHRAPAVESPFGEGVALLRPESGQVFVLRGPAADAWARSVQPVAGRVLAREVRNRVGTPADARAAVRTLVAMELLTSAGAEESAGGDIAASV